MKRGRAPLLRMTEPDTFLIDTSAWLNIDSRPDADDVWMLVLSLIRVGRVVVPRPVLGELRDNPIYAVHLKPSEAAITAGDRDDPDYLLHVGRITHAHPAMSRARGAKTPADPFVVALADMERYVVVCDESRLRPSRKIPGVCDRRRIRCITLDQFIEEARKALGLP